MRFKHLKMLGLFKIITLCVTIPSQSAENRVPGSLLHIPNSNYFSKYALVMEKKTRTLSVWAGESGQLSQIKTYNADFGKNPGDKHATNDHKTPEGIYFFDNMLEGAGLDFKLYGSRAFTMDYPNIFDKLLGKTGHGIWLHAIPDTVGLDRGSRGCVVIRNESIQDISQFIRLKHTPIIVLDEVPMITLEDSQKRAMAVRALVESWRSSWVSEDIEAYIKNYSPSFRAQGMNVKKWKAYKQGLNEKYSSIEVKLSNPVIFEYSGNLVVKFLQSYKSDQHADFGEKIMYLQKAGDQLQIVSEEWSPINDNSILAELDSNALKVSDNK